MQGQPVWHRGKLSNLSAAIVISVAILTSPGSSATVCFFFMSSLFFQCDFSSDISKVLINTTFPSFRSHMCNGLAKHAMSKILPRLVAKQQCWTVIGSRLVERHVGFGKIGCTSSLSYGACDVFMSSGHFHAFNCKKINKNGWNVITYIYLRYSFKVLKRYTFYYV